MIKELLGIADKILSHWTPEKIKARARMKLEKLKKERDAIYKKDATPANIRRLHRLNAEIDRLQQYFINQ